MELKDWLDGIGFAICIAVMYLAIVVVLPALMGV